MVPARLYVVVRVPPLPPLAAEAAELVRVLAGSHLAYITGGEGRFIAVLQAETQGLLYDPYRRLAAAFPDALFLPAAFTAYRYPHALLAGGCPAPLFFSLPLSRAVTAARQLVAGSGPELPVWGADVLPAGAPYTLAVELVGRPSELAGLAARVYTLLYGGTP